MAQCRTLVGDGAGVETALPYSGTRRHDIYWRFRDGYRIEGERNAQVVLRLVTTTWGSGQSATIAFREAPGRWRAAHLAYGAETPTRYSLWRTGALAPELGGQLDALLADACLAGEPKSVVGNITAPGGGVIGKCGDAVGSVTHMLEVSLGGRSRMFTRQCAFGVAGALAERLYPPELAGPETEERF